MAVLEREKIITSEGNILIQDTLRRILEHPQHPAKLVGADGTELPLPEKVYELLMWVTHQMAQGKAISLIPREQKLTTQQAADLLNVSRPYLIKLLEEQKIPFTKTGTHRRVKIEDVLTYKEQRRQQMHERINEMEREEAALEL